VSALKPWKYVLLLVLNFAFAAHAWRARTLAEYQSVRIVATIEAEKGEGAAPVADKLASGGQAVELSPGAAGVSFETRFVPGVYGVWLYARVPEAQVEGPWPPLYLEMTVQPPKGPTEKSRQRVAYQPIYQVVSRLYFIAREKGKYRISLAVGSASQVRGLLLDFVEIRDELDGCILQAVKSARTLTDDATLARIRAGAPQRDKPIPHVLSANATLEEMAALADKVWASLPPINATLGGCDAPTLELAELAKKMSRGQFKPTGIFEPWALMDSKTGARYDAADYAAGRPFEGGLPDIGGGYYAPVGEYGVTDRPRTIAPLAEFFAARLDAILQEADLRSADYEKYGDPVSAREAAILLAALADRYPTLDGAYQSMSYFGKVCYERFNQACGSAIPTTCLARIYDRIFDAIKDDADLARAIGSKVPFVRRPKDLRAFLDRNAIQYNLALHFRFTYRAMQMGWERNVTDLLLALGPSAIGQKWMDRLFRQCYADLTGNGSYADYLVNGINRDGSNYVGATSYTLAVPANMVRNAVALERFVRLGGKVPRFAWDLQANPRLLEAGTFLLNFRAAGGFWTLFGEGGGAIDQRFETIPTPYYHGDVFTWLFCHTGDARYAWMARAYGRRPEISDEEWERIEAAAQGQQNPILHAPSVVMPGFGCTLLELGSKSTDPKQKGCACVRFGTGVGHQQGDLLDLTLYAYNQRIVSDGGRSGWPWMRFTAQHNLVEVDRASFQSTSVYSGAYGYPLMMCQVDGPAGAAFTSAGGFCSTHPDLDDYRRDVAMIDLGTREDAPGLSLRHYYVFDVQRVGGGRVHTYCTHGMQAREIAFNVKDEPAPDAPSSLVYGCADPSTGIVADPLVTTWLAGNRRGRKADHGLRHHLFGWGGLRFYCAWGTHRTYNLDIPFVWIERESDHPLHDAYAAVFEPFFREPNLVSVRALPVRGGAPGSRAPRAAQVVSRWGRTDTIVVNEAGQRVVVDAAPGTAETGALLETDAHFVLVAEDASGLVQATMVGGTCLRGAAVHLRASRGAYEGKVLGFDLRTRALTTEPSLPVARTAGALVAFGRKPHLAAERLHESQRDVAGNLVESFPLPRLARLPEIFRSPIQRVDEKESAVYPVIALPLTAAEPRYYEGCTATNASHSKFWRVERTEVVEMWMPLFTPIREADITDADGDGQRTVRLTNFAPPERTRDPDILYYGPFVKPVRMKQYNREPFQEPVVLEVTRVDEKRRILYFKPPLHDYDLVWNGWVYDGTIITNEAGDRQWRSLNYPAREFRLILSGAAPPRAADFPPSDPTMVGDRLPRIYLYDFGPGDPYRLETFVSVYRTADGGYRAESNTDAQVLLSLAEVTVRQ